MSNPITEFRLRADPPLTMEAAAALFGVSVATVSRWESGLRNPEPQTAIDLEREHGIPRWRLRPDLWEPPHSTKPDTEAA